MLSFRELDQKYWFGGNISYGVSYLEFLFRRFNGLRINAILQDAAGAVWSYRCKDSGYSSIIGRDQIRVCLVKWLDYSFAFTYNSLFVPFSALLTFELADKNVIKKLGVFTGIKHKGDKFGARKTVQTHKTSIFDIQEVCTELCRAVALWNTVNFPKLFQGMERMENF